MGRGRRGVGKGQESEGGGAAAALGPKVAQGVGHTDVPVQVGVHLPQLQLQSVTGWEFF